MFVSQMNVTQIYVRNMPNRLKRTRDFPHIPSFIHLEGTKDRPITRCSIAKNLVIRIYYGYLFVHPRGWLGAT